MMAADLILSKMLGRNVFSTFIRLRSIFAVLMGQVVLLPHCAHTCQVLQLRASAARSSLVTISVDFNRQRSLRCASLDYY